MCADTTIEQRIEISLAKIRPYLEADGGDVRFLRMRENGVLEVQWLGTCAKCPMSLMTLRAGIERIVMKDIPEIQRVEALTTR